MRMGASDSFWRYEYKAAIETACSNFVDPFALSLLGLKLEAPSLRSRGNIRLWRSEGGTPGPGQIHGPMIKRGTPPISALAVNIHHFQVSITSLDHPQCQGSRPTKERQRRAFNHVVAYSRNGGRLGKTRNLPGTPLLPDPALFLPRAPLVLLQCQSIQSIATTSFTYSHAE